MTATAIDHETIFETIEGLIAQSHDRATYRCERADLSETLFVVRYCDDLGEYLYTTVRWVGDSYETEEGYASLSSAERAEMFRQMREAQRAARHRHEAECHAYREALDALLSAGEAR